MTTTWIVIYFIVSIANAILFVPDFWKNSKAEIGSNPVRTIFHIIFLFFTPNINAISFIMFSLHKIYKSRGKNSKKNPELVSLNILEEIYRLYRSTLSFYDREKYNFQLKTGCTNEQRKSFGEMVILEEKLLTLIIGLKNTHSDPETARILMENEIMLTRIYTIIKESESINDDLKFELLSISQDSLNIFIFEFVRIKANEEKNNKDAEEATRNRLISELKEEIKHQKYRTKVWTNPL